MQASFEQSQILNGRRCSICPGKPTVCYQHQGGGVIFRCDAHRISKLLDFLDLSKWKELTPEEYVLAKILESWGVVFQIFLNGTIVRMRQLIFMWIDVLGIWNWKCDARSINSVAQYTNQKDWLRNSTRLRLLLPVSSFTCNTRTQKRGSLCAARTAIGGRTCLHRARQLKSKDQQPSRTP